MLHNGSSSIDEIMRWEEKTGAVIEPVVVLNMHVKTKLGNFTSQL